MAVSLLGLSNGCSPEFEPDDIDLVHTAISELYGAPVIERWTMETGSCRFGGASFAYRNAWDDPCLISSDRRGDAILERLAARLAG